LKSFSEAKRDDSSTIEGNIGENALVRAG